MNIIAGLHLELINMHSKFWLLPDKFAVSEWNRLEDKLLYRFMLLRGLRPGAWSTSIGVQLDWGLINEEGHGT